jgi:hypothetical protein
LTISKVLLISGEQVGQALIISQHHVFKCPINIRSLEAQALLQVNLTVSFTLYCYLSELDVQVTITYNLQLSVSAVVPSSKTTDLQTYDDLSDTFYVVGNTFRPIYNNVTCRIGNRNVAGYFLPNNGTGMLVDNSTNSF